MKKSKNLEQAEVEIGTLWGLWEGKEGFGPTVEYPTDFKISDVAEDLKNDFAVLRMNISESFNKAVKKRAAARYIKLDPKETEHVAEEIERSKQAGAATGGQRGD